MRGWIGWLWIMVLAGGTVSVYGGCESSGDARREAGASDAPSPDVPLSTGGVSGAGGAIGGGTNSTAAGGAGTAGITSGTGGRNKGGAAAGIDGATGDGPGSGGAMATDAGATGGASGFDAVPASTYSGCMYIGGIDRAIVAKFDPQAGLCVALVLSEPAFGPDAGFGLTITKGWGVEYAGLWPSTTADCAQRFVPMDASSAADSASGSVTINSSSATIDVDAVLYFPATDAGAARSVELKAQAVDIKHGC
jgi:hypothetical protein